MIILKTIINKYAQCIIAQTSIENDGNQTQRAQKPNKTINQANVKPYKKKHLTRQGSDSNTL